MNILSWLISVRGRTTTAHLEKEKGQDKTSVRDIYHSADDVQQEDGDTVYSPCSKCIVKAAIGRRKGVMQACALHFGRVQRKKIPLWNVH
eukprot:212978-Heterocapsa_arctica.AAC.1